MKEIFLISTSRPSRRLENGLDEALMFMLCSYWTIPPLDGEQP